jgi:hypothetical protein
VTLVLSWSRDPLARLRYQKLSRRCAASLQSSDSDAAAAAGEALHCIICCITHLSQHEARCTGKERCWMLFHLCGRTHRQSTGAAAAASTLRNMDVWTAAERSDTDTATSSCRQQQQRQQITHYFFMNDFDGFPLSLVVV